GVIPPLAWRPGRVAAAASGENDQLAIPEQPAARRRLVGEATCDEVVDPRLDRARGPKVVERQPEQHRIRREHLTYELCRQVPAGGLLGRVLPGGNGGRG